MTKILGLVTYILFLVFCNGDKKKTLSFEVEYVLSSNKFVFCGNHLTG